VGDKTLWILIAAAAVYFLFVRKATPTGYRPAAPAAYRPPQPQPQPSAGQQAIQAGASALGSFLGQWARGSSSSSSSSDDGFSAYSPGSGGTAFADDSFDSDSYAFS